MRLSWWGGGLEGGRGAAAPKGPDRANAALPRSSRRHVPGCEQGPGFHLFLHRSHLSWPQIQVTHKYWEKTSQLRREAFWTGTGPCLASAHAGSGRTSLQAPSPPRGVPAHPSAPHTRSATHHQTHPECQLGHYKEHRHTTFLIVQRKNCLCAFICTFLVTDPLSFCFTDPPFLVCELALCCVIVLCSLFYLWICMSSSYNVTVHPR